VGNHVVFGEQRYAPSSDAGRSLLAHELAHVVQQGARPPPPRGWPPWPSGPRQAVPGDGRRGTVRALLACPW
jgi:hypothetical protein